MNESQAHDYDAEISTAHASDVAKTHPHPVRIGSDPVRHRATGCSTSWINRRYTGAHKMFVLVFFLSLLLIFTLCYALLNKINKIKTSCINQGLRFGSDVFYVTSGGGP